jgi:hypothetical protein
VATLRLSAADGKSHSQRRLPNMFNKTAEEDYRAQLVYSVDLEQKNC